uniref:Uncharacterized protein n=1 Tax=Tanacetum cinerariifolium TaxID=118510 RepID=A0A699IZR7_TANCI|nr:hypothetical protein [Tanacetum cinerariifolium]
MAASAIIVSSNSSDERVGSPPSRVILFGDIPIVIPSTSVIALETSAIAHVISSAALVVETTTVALPTGLCGLVPYSDFDSDSPDEMDSLEYITPLPATSPFLFTDSFEASDSSDGPPSQDPYTIIVAHWRSRITTRSSSPSDFSIAPVIASPGTHHRPSSSSLPTDSLPVHSSGLDAPGSLALTLANLLPPRKRFRDSDSSETSIEEDTEIDTTETKDGRELDIVDGDDVRNHIKVDPRDDMEEFEASAGDTVVLGIDPRSVPMVDRRLSSQLEEILLVHLALEMTLSASGSRAGMAERIRSLRLENLKIHDDRDDLRRKLRRLESFAERRLRTMIKTRSGMTPAAIEEMTNRRMAEAPEDHEINKNLGLENINGN